MKRARFPLTASAAVALAFASAAAQTARADEVSLAPAQTLDPRRYELAGFPIISGNSDLGVQFGGAATLTRFYDQDFPYAWNIDLLLTASIKNDNGLRVTQESDVIRLDAPDLFSSKLRLDTRLSFQRTVNAGYFGLGNAASGAPSAIPFFYQYTQEEGRIRSIGRVHTPVLGVDFAFGANVRYESPSLYPNSKLEEDLTPRAPGEAPVAIGGGSGLLLGASAGVMIDTRDSEFITRRGIFYQLGLGGTAGTFERIGYGEASAVLAHYAPLGSQFVFASRFVASFQFGRLPFYDLQQGGVFEPQYLLGSETGVRGVPEGRYGGPIKIIANLEVRGTPLPRFTFLGQNLRIGTTTFFDAGRLWDQYAGISPADGDSLGLKFGVGAGLFLQWGEAAIFRVEAAYSPDAVSENPGFPIEIYVSDGLMF